MTCPIILLPSLSGGAERGPVRAGQPAGRPARGSRSCALCGVPRPAPRVAAAYVRAGRRARARCGGRGRAHPLGCDSPAFLASLCSPFSGVFQFLDRFISLARKIGYVTIKPMTNTARYLCFSWLMCNRREKAAWPAITVLQFEKNRSSGNVQKRTIFRSCPEYQSCIFRPLSSAHRNIGPRQSGKSGLPKSKMTEYRALRVKIKNTANLFFFKSFDTCGINT